MGAQQIKGPGVVDDHEGSVNEVRLIGRLAADPLERELSSGGTLWTFKVEVPRAPSPGLNKPRQRSDQLECAVWERRLQRAVAKRHAGDEVEVTGALRRRFFQAGGTTASRTDVEVSGLRVLRRARTG